MRPTREHKPLTEELLKVIIDKRAERRALLQDRQRDEIACRIHDARTFARKQRKRFSLFNTFSSRRTS